MNYEITPGSNETEEHTDTGQAEPVTRYRVEDEMEK